MTLNKSLLASTAIIASLLASNVALASDTTSAKAKNEGWNVPNVALGNGLTNDEQKSTLELLGINEKSSYNSFIVNGDDLVKYVTDVPEFTSDSKAYSSAYIVRTNDGDGVNVEIATPKNITARTEANYRNAAITSGIFDADIKIASVRVMDGSGALAGIYKIYDEVEPAATEEEQQERDQNREVAQQESAVTADITNSNNDNKQFSDENLAVAMADIKLELQKINDTLDTMNTEQAKEKIKSVVDKELASQQLEDFVTPEQKDKIIETMMAFQNSPSIDNEQLKEQLTHLKDDIMDNGKEFLNNAKDKLTNEEARGFLSNLWDKVSNFFTNLFN
ncbi:DUF1002 domain-containing protein [Vagococcus xieshaowenii]|uniref:DUF1002 domain-containing protein n=1 Tax=Vagococcus xieshaowenii TaxID=2562451 RepID=A0AAJ5JQS4_9ENTE|nr:DUF1002 domain-containing protein [Vagococcus xieshaowenii]QCA28203.1 DUF1002 domain-containing protein [Vagococcus xieshaowenii]TFZ42555.1 DUF1002 domain-containing protein [Vagococcus xieshaowenii]